MHVCVLGAGIVGLTTAYELRQRGYQVTVVDRAHSGAGASGGNGAQLSYSYVQPLADPSVWAQLPKLLLSADSPLKFRLQWDVRQWLWGVQFLRACNTDTSCSTTQKLLLLAARSRAGLELAMRSHGLACDYSNTGKLVLYNNAESFASAQRQMDLQAHLGCVQEAVSAQRCVDIEPALQTYQPQIVGAIYTPSECAADCFKMCLALEVLLRRQGVQFLLGTELQGFTHSHDITTAAKTSVGDVQADQFVLAMGAGSTCAARWLGVRLPVYPLKGYSITLDLNLDQSLTAPVVNVTDAARKVVFARVGQRLRVAGMAELVGHDYSITTERIESLQRSTQAVFPQCDVQGNHHAWTGMRPATPTGLPIVGRIIKAPNNLLFNTGHGALGFTLAFGTAAMVAELVSKTQPTQLGQSFSVKSPYVA